MTNKLYLKGYRKERRIVNEARENGCIAFRSAGSHSPIDVVIIDPAMQTIQFIQAKYDSMSDKKKEELEMELIWLNNEFKVSFEVQ